MYKLCGAPNPLGGLGELIFFYLYSLFWAFFKTNLCTVDEPNHHITSTCLVCIAQVVEYVIFTF